MKSQKLANMIKLRQIRMKIMSSSMVRTKVQMHILKKKNKSPFTVEIIQFLKLLKNKSMKVTAILLRATTQDIKVNMRLVMNNINMNQRKSTQKNTKSNMNMSMKVKARNIKKTMKNLMISKASNRQWMLKLIKVKKKRKLNLLRTRCQQQRMLWIFSLLKLLKKFGPTMIKIKVASQTSKRLINSSSQHLNKWDIAVRICPKSILITLSKVLTQHMILKYQRKK